VVGRSAAASELYFLLFFLKFLQPGLRLLLLYSNLKTVLKKKLMNSCRSTNLYPNKRHKKKGKKLIPSLRSEKKRQENLKLLLSALLAVFSVQGF
jgi:hypothetical protein